MNADGIHAHPTKKLGLRPSDPNKPVLRLAEFLKAGAVPPHPLSADHTPGVTPGLYRNDSFGVCGPTEVCNDRRLITTRAGAYSPPSQDDCFDLYRRSGNPNFDPATGADDNGVSMKTMLSAVVKHGVGDGKGGLVQALGFAAVDVTNREEMRAAMDIFGSLHIAVDLKEAQQSTSDEKPPYWDYTAGSAGWGGHAILVVKNAPGEDDVWSWGQLIKMTEAFEQHQLQEAYVVIWPEHQRNPALYAALDMPAFSSAYTAITDRPYPGAVVPPQPGPAPTPAPVGGGASFRLTAPVAAAIHSRAVRAHMTDEDWLEHRMRVYLELPPV